MEKELNNIDNLTTFINDLQKLKQLRCCGNCGKDFENLVKNIFLKNSIQLSFNKKAHNSIYKEIENGSEKQINEIIKNLKKELLEKNSIKFIKNPFKNLFNNSNIYIYISTFWITTIPWFFDNYKKLCFSIRNKI